MVKSPFPWAELAQIGFGELRLSPKAFWASSPRELTLAAQAKQKMFGHVAPLEPQRMAVLMADFPDGDNYES